MLMGGVLQFIGGVLRIWRPLPPSFFRTIANILSMHFITTRSVLVSMAREVIARRMQRLEETQKVQLKFLSSRSMTFAISWRSSLSFCLIPKTKRYQSSRIFNQSSLRMNFLLIFTADLFEVEKLARRTLLLGMEIIHAVYLRLALVRKCEESGIVKYDRRRSFWMTLSILKKWKARCCEISSKLGTRTWYPTSATRKLILTLLVLFFIGSLYCAPF